MSRDDENTIIDPLDHLLDADLGGLPVDAKGRFKPGEGYSPSVIPPATESTFICLRGPCKHYMQTVIRFNSGNAEGSPGTDARLTRRGCMAITGYEMDLTEEVVYDCSHWEPRSDAEVSRIETVRAEYWKRNPAQAAMIPHENGATKINPPTEDQPFITESK